MKKVHITEKNNPQNFRKKSCVLNAMKKKQSLIVSLNTVGVLSSAHVLAKRERANLCNQTNLRSFRKFPRVKNP